MHDNRFGQAQNRARSHDKIFVVILNPVLDCDKYFKMRDVVGKLKEGKSVEIPIYDFTLHQRVKETKRVYGATGNSSYINIP